MCTGVQLCTGHALLGAVGGSRGAAFRSERHRLSAPAVFLRPGTQSVRGPCFSFFLVCGSFTSKMGPPVMPPSWGLDSFRLPCLLSVLRNKQPVPWSESGRVSERAGAVVCGAGKRRCGLEKCPRRRRSSAWNRGKVKMPEPWETPAFRFPKVLLRRWASGGALEPLAGLLPPQLVRLPPPLLVRLLPPPGVMLGFLRAVGPR